MNTTNDENTRKKHNLQILAAVIITLIVMLLFGIYAVIYLTIGLPLPLKAVLAGIMICFIGAMAGILVQRIREIRKGENDDLGNY